MEERITSTNAECEMGDDVSGDGCSDGYEIMGWDDDVVR